LEYASRKRKFSVFTVYQAPYPKRLGKSGLCASVFLISEVKTRWWSEYTILLNLFFADYAIYRSFELSEKFVFESVMKFWRQ
jgi:hypothetical protein